METVYVSVRKVKGGFIVDCPSTNGYEEVFTSLSKVLKVVKETLSESLPSNVGVVINSGAPE